MARLDAFFKKMIELEASDLHLTTGMQPYFRLHGDMTPVTSAPTWEAEEMLEVLFEITPKVNQKQFKAEHDTDFAYALPGKARFRSNLFMDKNGPAAVFRLIPAEILTVEQLGLPQAVKEFCFLSKGLVLVTGPTGSGKSTTLAAIVDMINKVRSDHIITIEDPIEFVHQSQKCLVRQREVGTHTESFKRALRAALREDPDIILVGELRDLETIEIAIETAETGHLVFGTLHTTTAPSTIDRIIDQFPAERQSQIRTMLAASLKGVVAQTLCKKKPKGRCAALEILVGTNAVSALIREGKTHQIVSQMQMGGKIGMKLLNDSLKDLVQQGLVDPLEAYTKAVDKDGLKMMLEHIGVKIDFRAASNNLVAPAQAISAPPQARPSPPPVEPEAARPVLDLDATAAVLPDAPPPPIYDLDAVPEAADPGSGEPDDPFEQFRKNRGR